MLDLRDLRSTAKVKNLRKDPTKSTAVGTSASALAEIVSNPKYAQVFCNVESVQLLVHTLLRDWDPMQENLVLNLLLLLGMCMKSSSVKKHTKR